MKGFLRIKWELIMLGLNLIASGVAWFSYFYTKEANVLVIAITTLVTLAVVICNYKTISYMRKLTYRMW